MLFLKKSNYIRIIADKAANLSVQKFIDKHVIKGTTIDMWDTGDFITIKFHSKKSEDAIYKSLRKELNDQYRIEKFIGFISATTK